ncbi:MAG: glycoside hydrolase family 97 catalytic domain-containing protein [Bacteroidales bacterium]
MQMFLTLLSLFLSIATEKQISIKSPDGKTVFNLVNHQNSLYFTASANGKVVFEESPVKMLVDNVTITEEAKTTSVKRTSESEKYPVYGYHSTGISNCTIARVSLTHLKSYLRYYMEIKVFNDGFAFRFIVPGEALAVRVPDEATEFVLPAGSEVWYHNLRMHYEGEYTRKMIDTIPEGQWAAPPVTVKLPDGTGYTAITEANLVNYPGMALQTTGKKGFIIRLGHTHPISYPYELRYSKEDIERVTKPAVIKGTIVTPWRVAITGTDLNTLVNSDIITNLCPPPDKSLFPDGLYTKWIRPGRAVWRYLDGGGDNSLKNMMEFSRLAGELGFEYNVLEGFWSKWPDDSIKTLVDYSKKINVGIIVWKHSKELRAPNERVEFFDRLVKLGIAGIKIDFFDHEAKEVIDLYESIFRECAEKKLLLILHGANKPTGLQRTYPNVLIYEAVRGMEASRLVDRATHQTIIPFTRMLAGPADYSVCHFGERRRNTTWVNQIATVAIYAAPVITYAANPFNLVSNPCIEMIKSIPPVWDETIVLYPSGIGEIAIYAQRKGTTWFLS